MRQSEKDEILKVRINGRLKRQLKVEAIDQNATMADVVERALMKYLRNQWDARAGVREAERRSRKAERVVDDVVHDTQRKSLRKTDTNR